MIDPYTFVYTKLNYVNFTLFFNDFLIWSVELFSIGSTNIKDKYP